MKQKKIVVSGPVYTVYPIRPFFFITFLNIATLMFQKPSNIRICILFARTVLILAITFSFTAIRAQEAYKVTPHKVPPRKTFRHKVSAHKAQPAHKVQPHKARVQQTPKAEKKDPITYRTVKQMPEFQGDLNQYLSGRLRYPEAARKANIEGRVIIEFTVFADGNIQGARVVSSSGTPDLDSEALRVIKEMPAWKPGRIDGEAVNVFFNLPISFKLD